MIFRHLNHSKTPTASISRGVARPITIMSHNTNKACCTIPPVSSNYESKGKYLEPGYGFGKTYVVGPDNSETAVICKFTSLRSSSLRRSIASRSLSASARAAVPLAHDSPPQGVVYRFYRVTYRDSQVSSTSSASGPRPSKAQTFYRPSSMSR